MEDTKCGAGLDPRLVGDPVDTLTGAVIDAMLDFRLTGPIELRWTRYYDSSKSDSFFSLGRACAHEFDRTLSVDAEGLVYDEPVRRSLRFPPLLQDGDECAFHGFTLQRVTARRYLMLSVGAPAMEFEFAPQQRLARLGRLLQQGRQVRFVYDAELRLVRIDDSAGRRLSAQEDEYGRLVRLAVEPTPTTPGWVLIAYQYDEHGNLVRTSNGEGHGYKFTYDDANRVVMREGRKGFRFYYKYDQQGRCVRSMGDDRLFGVVMDYAVPGRVTKVTRPDRGEWTYTFTPQGALKEIKDPLGGAQKFVRDAATGQLAQEIDPNGNLSQMIHDASGASVVKIDPFGRRIPLPEDVNAPDPTWHRVAGNGAEYEFGRLLALDAVVPPLRHEVLQLGLVAEVAQLVVTRTGNPPPGPGFDVPPLRALWWPRPKRGRVFNDLGKLRQQHDDFGRVRHWSYDQSGNAAEHIDFDGSKWIYDHGTWHFRKGLTMPTGAMVTYTYTAQGDVASVTDAGGTVSEYAYDCKDQLTEVRRHGEVRDIYKRDACGNLVAKHARDGRELLRFEIGHGNRPVKRSLASGDEHTFKYDALGRQLQAATANDELEFAYDGNGNRTVDQRNGSGVRHRFLGGKRLAQSLLFGRFKVGYEWQDRTLTITDPTGRQHALRFLSHGVSERRFSNGSVETSQHDALGRCLFKHTRLADGRPWARRYDWSGEGELRQVEDSLHGVVRHQYDAAHRLQQRSIGGQVEVYQQDAADNLLAQPGLADTQLFAGNRLQAANGETFSYNDRDHVEQRQGEAGATQYRYDSRDQLVRAELPAGVWEARYDALGRRSRKTWAGQTTEYYWGGDQLLAEVSASGAVRLYVYPDTLALTPLVIVDYASLEAEADSGRVYAVFSDQLGAPLLIEDETGNEMWRASIAPFGGARITARAGFELNLRLPGHYFDAELGLHYNRFRYYDPVLGRYLQSDPWGLAGGFNVYAYRTNPLLISDVRGLGEDGDEACKPPGEDSEGTPRRQSIADREAEGADIPQYARDNPDLYEYDTQSGRYRRKEGEGHSRGSEFPSGYRESTHEAMVERHTDEGRAQGTGRPVDANGDPIPRDQLTWRDGNDNEIPFYDSEGNTNVTYDHQTSAVEMYNDGATTTNPQTGETTTYPPGRDTNRDTRNDFYNDPNNLVPMSRSENSSKGGSGQGYNDQPTGPNYES